MKGIYYNEEHRKTMDKIVALCKGRGFIYPGIIRKSVLELCRKLGMQYGKLADEMGWIVPLKK